MSDENKELEVEAPKQEEAKAAYSEKVQQIKDADVSKVQRKPRFWPLYVLICLCVIQLILVQLGVLDSAIPPLEEMEQVTVFLNLLTGMLYSSLLLAWWLFFSRFAIKVKAAGFGVFILLCLALSQMIRLENNGDMAPIVHFSWERKPGEVTEEVERVVQTAVTFEAELADDFSQFRGMNRDGKVLGLAFDPDWKKNPPQELWRKQIGAGWAGFAVRGTQAVTLEQREDEEWVTSYDLGTGELQWSHRYAARHNSSLGGLGPRSTPTIADDDCVYAMGATGVLTCVRLKTGKLVWTRNLLEEKDAQAPMWGIAASPLVIGKTVYIAVGGEEGNKKSYLFALKTETGEDMWVNEIPGASYASPVLIRTADGQEQLISINQQNVAAYNRENGETFWQVDWPGKYPKIAMPLPIPTAQKAERLFVSSDYGYGSYLYELGEITPEKKWYEKRFRSKFAGLFYHEGRIYTISGSRLSAADVETGKIIWRHRDNFGHGQMIMILPGNSELPYILIQCEDGDLALVKLIKEGDKEKAQTVYRMEALPGKTWNTPTLAGKYLLLRNHMEMVCYRLK